MRIDSNDFSIVARVLSQYEPQYELPYNYLNFLGHSLLAAQKKKKKNKNSFYQAIVIASLQESVESLKESVAFLQAKASEPITQKIISTIAGEHLKVISATVGVVVLTSLGFWHFRNRHGENMSVAPVEESNAPTGMIEQTVPESENASTFPSEENVDLRDLIVPLNEAENGSTLTVEENDVSETSVEPSISQIEEEHSSSLQPAANFESLSDEELGQLKKLSEIAVGILQENLGYSIEEMIKDALSKRYERVSLEFQTLQDAINKLDDGHSKLKNDIEPLNRDYLAKASELQEIKDLEASLQVKTFYSEVHNFLSSIFFSAIVLKSGKIQRASSKKQTFVTAAAGHTAEGITTFIGVLLSVATFGAGTPAIALGTAAAAAAAGKAVEEAVESRFTKFHEKRDAFKLKIAGNAQQAMHVSELLARRITQKLLIKIEQFTPEVSALKAKQAGDEILSFIAVCASEKKQYQAIEDVIQDIVEAIDLGDKKKKKFKEKCSIM